MLPRTKLSNANKFHSGFERILLNFELVNITMQHHFSSSVVINNPAEDENKTDISNNSSSLNLKC